VKLWLQIDKPVCKIFSDFKIFCIEMSFSTFQCKINICTQIFINYHVKLCILQYGRKLSKLFNLTFVFLNNKICLKYQITLDRCLVVLSIWSKAKTEEDFCHHMAFVVCLSVINFLSHLTETVLWAFANTCHPFTMWSEFMIAIWEKTV
jgi:hypothetical protein